MKVHNAEIFMKYVNHPVRIKRMNSKIVAIAEGYLIATFKTDIKLREYFPYGNYVKLN